MSASLARSSPRRWTSVASAAAATFGRRPSRPARQASTACASSNHAIGEGMRLIRDGYLDVCISGGSESATLPLTVAAFA